MVPLDFTTLAQQCAPTVAHQTMAAVAATESSFNPYAIGVVGGRLERQPRSLDEAISTSRALVAQGWNFSVGIGQVNRHNLEKNALSLEDAFSPCANLRASATILADCFKRASVQFPDQRYALKAAFSCYYSGNFTRGFKPDRSGQLSYVDKVLARADGKAPPPIQVVPSVVDEGTPDARQGGVMLRAHREVMPAPSQDAPFSKSAGAGFVIRNGRTADDQATSGFVVRNGSGAADEANAKRTVGVPAAAPDTTESTP
jgi:type IV secretion system protein VirB1